MLTFASVNNIVYPQYVDVKKDNKMSALSFHGVLKDIEPKNVWKYMNEISKIYRESTDPEKPETFDNQKEISNWFAGKLSNLDGDLKFKVFQDPGYTQKEREQKLKDLGLSSTDKIGDKKYNIIATRGLDKDSKNLIILQAHLDMVCVSDNKDPKKKISFKVDGNWVKANGRTAGFDNGMGLAHILAIAENPKFKDIPLMILATTDEETGTCGAKGLTSEQLMAWGAPQNVYLINGDSEEVGLVINGCSGLQKFVETRDVKMSSVGKSNYKKVVLSMKDGSGGHSGVDINIGRINTIKETISVLNKMQDVKLIAIEGGDKFNSIPNSVNAEFLLPDNFDDKNLSKIAEDIKSKYKETDPNLKVDIKIVAENASPDTLVLDKSFQDKMFSLVDGKIDESKEGIEKEKGLNVGAITTYPDGTTKTSQNLGIISLKDGKFSLTMSMRSSDYKEEKELSKKTASLLAELFSKKEVKPVGTSPIWQPVEGSILEKFAMDSYKEVSESAETKPLFDQALKDACELENNKLQREERQKNPIQVKTCHGGLEPADFAETINKYNKDNPDKFVKLEQISIGPELKFPHSTDERVNIFSVQVFQKVFENIMDKLKVYINK